MIPSLPLSEMTTIEKLSLMEVLWDDLCRTAHEVPSPAWHGEILAAREEGLKNGQSRFIDFAEMCERIRKETECET
jgi:hypothetical protein